MWEISNSDQTVTFLAALVLGAFFSLIYDVFKSLRLSFRHGAFTVALEDMLFFSVCTLFTFSLFMFRTNGQPRGYAYASIGLGFLIWRLTLSRYTVKILRRIFLLSALAFSKIKLASHRFFAKIGAYFEKVSKKLLSYAKKGLKGAKRLVYNLIKRIIGK